MNCSTWFSNFGVNDSSLPCYYSRTNTSLALTHVDTDRDRLDLILSITIPSLLFTISIIIICILHAECCRKFSRHKQRYLSVFFTGSKYHHWSINLIILVMNMNIFQ